MATVLSNTMTSNQSNDGSGFDCLVFENSNSTRPSLLVESLNFTFDNQQTSLLIDSTDSKDITVAFEHYLTKFQESEANFIYTLTHSYFEDGMDNDAISALKSYFDLSPYPAISWFATLFNSHLQEPNITYRLLRCICDRTYSKYSKNLISFVRGSLNDKNIEVQEAAIMVLERWRTKECLDVIESTKYVNPLLEDYANTLKEELREELC